MATTATRRDVAVVVIPSSPPIDDPALVRRQQIKSTSNSSAQTSPSPGLPSPSEFMRGSQTGQKEPLKPITPSLALGGFRSVASLVRDGFRGDETSLEEESATTPGAVQKTKKSSKAISKKVEKNAPAEVATPQCRPRNAELQVVLEQEIAPESVSVALPPSAQRMHGGSTNPQAEEQGVIEAQKSKKATKRGAPRTRGTTARSRKRLKKSESIIVNSDEPEAVQKSIYFATEKHDVVPPTIDDSVTAPQIEATAHQEEGPAEPAKLEVRSQPTALSPPRLPSPDPETVTRSLSDVLGTLVYDPAAAQTPQSRALSGESFTKRRRIDLTDGPALAPPTATRKGVKAPESPERAAVSAKKQKKRPLTITELATAAYRPPEAEAVVDQLSVDAFLLPMQTAASTTATADEPASVKGTKVSKPRKARAKRKMVIINADGTKTVPPIKASKAPKIPKPRKTKVKFKEEDLILPLLSPQRARNVERAQGFLFGTSSQLAVEESPQCVRDMQLAIRLSEAGPSSQISMPEEIRSTLPPVRRPDTSISVGVTRRGLWRQATRDGEGLLHRSPPSAKEGGVDTELMEEGEQVTGIVAYEDAITTLPAPDGMDEDTAELPGVVNEMALPIENSPLNADPVLAPSSPIPPSSRPVSDDNWMLLPSDSSTADAEVADNNAPIPIVSSPLRVPSLHRAATSPMPRSPLRSLDRNMPLFQSAHPEKSPLASHRQFLSTAVVEPTKKPHGRRKKQAAAELAHDTVPKKRGRPKDKAQVAVPRNALSALTPPRPSPHTGPSQWTHIDEISDSEPPLTPSPPRQRASSSPPVLQPLDLAPSPSPTRTGDASSLAIHATATIKTTDAAWQEIKVALFPQITRLVKSTPPSTEMNQPTWHEKMLLYDPIVLEDLTAWLNANGLRYEYRRARPKSKRKSKKKRDDDGERVDEPEFDLVNEELKPWMVQKWCEEKSVCCLWKEGLRGGVRVRY